MIVFVRERESLIVNIVDGMPEMHSHHRKVKKNKMTTYIA